MAEEEQATDEAQTDNQAVPSEKGASENGESEVSTKVEEPSPEPKEKECEECKPGAPLWMATFADMATLLMAFFVLILSFTEARRLKYTQAAGAMEEAFGIQKEIEVYNRADGPSSIAKSHQPSMSNPALKAKIVQETIDEIDPEKELDRHKLPERSQFNSDKELLEELLAKELSMGQVQITERDKQVMVTVKKLGSADANRVDSPSLQDGGITPRDRIEIYNKVAQAQKTAQSSIKVRDFTRSRDKAGGQKKNGRLDDAVSRKIAELNLALAKQIASGTAEVERKGGQVIVRLHEQGAFSAGGATLDQPAINSLKQVGHVIRGNNGRVVIEGHSDNQRIKNNSRYPSNWDLSIARAASVAGVLSSQMGVASDRLSIRGLADTKPLVKNDTVKNRKRNRRIEIIMDVPVPKG